jgi:hypothetical protein
MAKNVIQKIQFFLGIVGGNLKLVAHGSTDQPMDRWTNIVTYRAAIAAKKRQDLLRNQLLLLKTEFETLNVDTLSATFLEFITLFCILQSSNPKQIIIN